MQHFALKEHCPALFFKGKAVMETKQHNPHPLHGPWQKNFISTLQQEFIRIKTLNTQYSMRSFAKRAQLSSGTLSSILSGKRAISLDLANTILSRLGLPALELHSKVELLSVEHFEIISSPLCYAIMTALTLNCEKAKTVTFLAHTLGKNNKETLQALKTLEKVQLAIEEDGEWRALKNFSEISSSVPNGAIRRFHQECLRESEKMLFEKHFSERNLQSQTLTADEETYEAIIHMAEEFREKVMALSRLSKGNRLIRVNIQTYFLDINQTGDNSL
jgi:transcriptional regulator with XRE-family HTH domain